MNKHPLVTLQTKNTFPTMLYRILEFHLPENSTIIDPTPGKLHSWQFYLQESKRKQFFPPPMYNLVPIPDDITTFLNTAEWVENKGVSDAIFFDPPYVFGSPRGDDVRREDYGGYTYTFEEVQNFIKTANEQFPKFLREEGLLFLKYTDVFSLYTRQFYLCANLWSQILQNFKPIDHYIIQHHHISPTAWQVKERPCGIVNYTYLTVFRKEMKE